MAPPALTAADLPAPLFDAPGPASFGGASSAAHGTEGEHDHGGPADGSIEVWDPSGDATFVVTTEEVPAGLPARVWQLNGSAAPTELSTFKVGTGTPHNVIMEGNMAYLSHYSEGAAVVDLTNPAAPKVVMRVDTSSTTGPGYTGCWGVYKFPGLPLMMCSDIGSGFHLIGITP